jgi:tRNA(Ile)-lysidine synthetase-like protein
MFRHTKRVLVGVSGGPDSVACLLLLLRLRATVGFDVKVAHFDHKLRDDSARDLQFVRALAERLGVECLTGEGDVRAVARERKSGIEETARRMRYQFLAFAAGKEAADCIAVGHTADDQAETVLLRIVRGSGIRGIRGMLPVAPVPGAEAQRLVRPLLELRRAETQAICADAGIEPIADASNADPAFTRNLLRHRTLAALREVNPAIEAALVGLAAHAREAFAPIERQALALQPECRTPVGAIFELPRFAELPSEALTLLVEREAAFYKLESEVNRTRLENLRAVLKRRAGVVQFGDVAVEASQWLLRVGPVLARSEPFAAILNVPGSTRAGPWRVDVSTEAFEPPIATTICRLDRAKIEGALRARSVREGDRMPYRRIERKVSDICGAAHIPRWERAGMVAIADAGRVLALFSAGKVFDEPPQSEDAFYVRLVRADPAT